MSREKQPIAVYDEAALKGFVLGTAGVDKSQALNKLDSVLKGSAQDSAIFHQTVAYLETPFGNPNSSFRNEDLYAAVLQAKMKSDWMDSLTKARTRERLYLLMQNRPGSAANDFNYLTPAGFKKRMSDLKAPFILLYFNNPGCDACRQMKEALAGSDIIQKKVQSQALMVLSVYTDPDEKLWLDHLRDYPEQWKQGRDAEGYLRQHSLYDLRAIPTIYLLDQDKKVLLKDCMNVGEIESKLMEGAGAK